MSSLLQGEGTQVLLAEASVPYDMVLEVTPRSPGPQRGPG